jgi:hypothetical protein
MINPDTQLFSSVSVLAEFHPLARAVQFWSDKNGQRHSKVVYEHIAPTAMQALEVDIAIIADQLGKASLPDFYQFCSDIELIFHGAQPSGPVAAISDIDWLRLRRISIYAQYWKNRNPAEVNKLLSFVMGIPLYSQIVAQLIASEKSDIKQEILQGITLSGGVYLVGVERYKQLFRREIDQAFNEAKVLVSAFRGTHEENAAELINSMVEAALPK